MKAFLSLALVLAFFAFPAAAAREPLRCDASAPREKIRVAKISPRLDIVLDDGRLVYFPTIEPPRATPAAPERPRESAAQLSSLLAGGEVEMEKLGGPDRWGRIPALVFVPGAAESADVTLAAAGLAMAAIGAGDCGKNVRAAEAEARAEKLGLWADPDFAVLAAENVQGFVGHGGTLALVEGRVTGIGHTAARTYLNFGQEDGVDRRGGFSLSIARRALKEFERAGFGPENLLHKNIRARGVVEIRAGPLIELFHPDQIEFMEGGR